MNLRRCITVLLVLTALSGCASSRAMTEPEVAAPNAEPVRNIILLIADGTGAGVWTAAVYARHDLAVKRMPVVGLVDTRSANARVTDSAAGATVYATGERATNRTIAVGGTCPQPASRDTVATTWPDGCEPLETWFAIAKSKGKATGIVTTTSVIDATPASFVAHSPSRYWRDAIAAQFAEADLDVLLGGGRRYFEAGTRTDGRELLPGMCTQADCVGTAAALMTYRAAERPLIGLFTPEDMDDVGARPVALPDMVDAALARLSLDPDGFVALFETEATDNATHANEPLERVTADILEFDRAVARALDFAERTPGTLVIVTSDHETGGFSLVQDGTDFELKYTTGGHTAEIVPLFAAGPQSARFGGFRDNIDVGRTLLDIVRSW